MQLLVEELVGRDDSRTHTPKALARLGKGAGTKRPCFVTRYDDPPVVASDEEEARLLPELLEDELRFAVSGNLREATSCQQMADPLAVAEPGDEIDVRMLARHAAEVEVETPPASKPETDLRAVE